MVRDVKSRLGSELYRRRHGRGRLIWDADWDICLVADATRSDLLREVLPDYDWLTPETGWSVGSSSVEWYGRTFSAVPTAERVGVVTANPFSRKPNDRDELSHWLKDATPIDRHVEHVDYVFEDIWGYDGPHGHIDVTPAEAVTDRAYEMWTGNDVDRLVVHYMQPHLPFRSTPEWHGKRGDLDHFGEPGSPYDGDGKEIWKQVRDGERGHEEVWAAYRDNLRWVLDDINRLREALNAEFLLTADHGNGMGEWGVWSHPPGVYTPQLRRVPWVRFSGTADRAFEPSRVGEETDGARDVSEQLEALGYA